MADYGRIDNEIHKDEEDSDEDYAMGADEEKERRRIGYHQEGGGEGTKGEGS